MESKEQLTMMIIVFTAMFFIIVFIVVLLMFINNKNRQEHKAKLAELELNKQKEINAAQREATAQTLQNVGRELHDNIGQLLIVTQMGLRNHIDGNGAEAKELERTWDILDQSIEEVRHLGRSLNEDHWSRLSLSQAILKDVERLRSVTKKTVSFYSDSEADDLVSDEKLIIYRCYQEIMANTLRHAQSQQITIELHHAPFSLSIQDDGRGFNPERKGEGAGIQNIQGRLEMIGHEGILTTAPGEGCHWLIKPSSAV